MNTQPTTTAQTGLALPLVTRTHEPSRLLMVFDANGNSVSIGLEPDEARELVRTCNSQPDLLEACKLALRYLRKMEADGTDTAAPVSRAVFQVNQAIAKATNQPQQPT